MGGAIIQGLLAAGWPEDAIKGAEPQPERAQKTRMSGVAVFEDPREAVEGCDAVVVAVKPYDVPVVLKSIKPVVTSDQVVISIAAGVSLSLMEEVLPGIPLVRAMPNTPALVQAGATGMALGEGITTAQAAVAQRVLEAVGLVEVVEEALLDVVTAVSGSGPAYVFLLAEAIIDSAEKAGLDRDVASSLVCQTMMGAGRLLRESGNSAAELREKVTSPGGTTAAAIGVFEEHGFRGLVEQAVEAAANRCRELGKQ